MTKMLWRPPQIQLKYGQIKRNYNISRSSCMRMKIFVNRLIRKSGFNLFTWGISRKRTLLKANICLQTQHLHISVVANVYFFFLLMMITKKTHLPQDPLAEENYGPTENLHGTFLISGTPRNKNKKTTRLPGWTYKNTAESKQSQQTGDKKY